MNNAVITHVSTEKNLGFWLNSQLKCFSHVDSTVHKIFFILPKLLCTASYLHSSLKLKLVKTLITPFLTFGANVFGDLDSVSFKKLQVSINNCSRFVYNKRKYDHISQ